MEMMEDFARRVFGLRKLTLQVLASNTEAVRLYERSGYTTVGVLRGHFMNGGFFHDVALMEKFLAAEVPA
jgi:RimJ/RimL family protein N-acetyltransferase